MECPECGSTRVHRSRRHGWVEQGVLATAGVYPYRCGDCRARFKRFRNRRDDGTPRISLRDPAPWMKLLLWVAFVGVASLVVSYVVVHYVDR